MPHQLKPSEPVTKIMTSNPKTITLNLPLPKLAKFSLKARSTIYLSLMEKN